MAKKKGGMGGAVKTGLAISAVAGAAYMLWGPDGKKHQKKLHEWASKVEKEVKKDVKIVKGVMADMKGPAKKAVKGLAKKAVSEGKKAVKKAVK